MVVLTAGHCTCFHDKDLYLDTVIVQDKEP